MPENSEVIERIRRSIEDPGLRRRHFHEDPDGWNKFCVAMDTIEDTDLAISDFLRTGLGNREGERYLQLYGVLQAIFIQQDAIKALWEIVMDEDFPEMLEDSSWRTIREIRNHSAGHPIEVRRGGVTRRTFITRIGLEHGMLSLITDQNNGHTVFWGGRLQDLVEKYLSEAIVLLRRIHDRIPEIWSDIEV